MAHNVLVFKDIMMEVLRYALNVYIAVKVVLLELVVLHAVQLILEL